jgi:hypothetical protein
MSNVFFLIYMLTVVVVRLVPVLRMLVTTIGVGTGVAGGFGVGANVMPGGKGGGTGVHHCVEMRSREQQKKNTRSWWYNIERVTWLIPSSTNSQTLILNIFRITSAYM